MSDNIFDQFDESAPAITGSGQPDSENIFDQFDAEQPPQPTAPAAQSPAPPTPVQNMPGVSVIDDAEMKDFLGHFNAANQREGTDKLNESRGRDFMSKLTTALQYEAELIKGVPGGAVSGVGTALFGAGAVKAGAEANLATFAQQQIAVMDRIDAGDFKAADQLHPSLAGYGQMTAPQRESARERLRRQFHGFTPATVEQQALNKAGAALKEHAKTILPAAPGYEEVWTRQIGEGLGSMAVGLPLALVGGGGAAGLLYGSMGAGEATERAIEYDRKEKAAGRPGLTQDDIIRSAIWGVGPGATDVLPVEMLLGRLKVPPALAKLGAKTIGRIGGQAFLRMAQQAVVEGSQEGFQQFLQNLIESRYNPEQKLGEDILPSAGVGAGVGGVAQAGKEMAQLALRRFAGRRGSGSPAPAGQTSAPGSAPQAAASPTQAPSSGPEAASQPAKVPSSAPDAAPAQTIQRDAAPETRAATREQFNQYLALEDQLAAIPDDVDAPPELINRAIDAEEAMVESFRATGLPGDNLARGTRPINSMDDVRRAFDEATPEEINEFWQGKAVGPAASSAAAGAGEKVTPDNVWKAIQEKDAGLSGEASRAIDAWVGGPHDAIAKGLTGGPMIPARLEAMPDADLDAMGAQVRPALRAAYGDTITVYRGEDGGSQSSGRKNRLVSYSTERGVSERFAGAQKERPLISEKEIVAAERQLKETGEARLGGRIFRDEGQLGIMMYDRDGQAITDTPSIRDEANSLNEAAAESNAGREKAMAGVREVRIPIDAVVWATDRFNQKEIIARAGFERDAGHLTPDFLRLLATPTPRDQWAQTLGVSEDELMPHVERAIASGLLRVDRNGVVRRNASAVAEMEPEVEAEGQKIEAAIESGAGPLLAPGIIEGENVTLTPKAIDKIQELQTIAEEAVAKILPRDVRIEVLDNIAIDRLAHEDNLLALRSSKSAKVSEGTEGESDELPGDSAEAGQAVDDASKSPGEGAIAAAVGGGGASGASSTEGRILRQESATLRADGSIRAGRISSQARTAVSGGLDAETLQPVGTSEFFDAPGLRGVVTANSVIPHADLDRRMAPPSEYRLANLTYRLYAADAPIGDEQLKHGRDGRFQPNFRAGGESHTPLIWALVSQHMDGTWEVSMVQRIADREMAPKGMSGQLYAAIEKDLGIRMSPSGILSKQGLDMWRKRSPESVKWHQKFKFEDGDYISPRRIKDRLTAVSNQVKFFAARMAENPGDAQIKNDWEGARRERGELIKLWTKLPKEARGATPNTMFATRINEAGGVEAIGQTNPNAKIISIGARAVEAEARATGKTEKKVTIETARHEALEFFLAKGFIKPDEWATLTDTARKENWIEAAGVREPYTKKFGEAMDAAQLEDLILKESIMVKYGEYERGNYAPKGVIAKVFKRIKDFLDRLRNSLKSQGFQRWEDIFQKMDAGEMRQRYEARFGRPAQAAQTRVTSKAVPAGGRIAAMTLPGLAQNAPLSPAPAGPTPGRTASAPGSLVDIQRNLRRKLGLTVASGRLDPASARAAGQAGGKLMGQFDRQTEVIRLRILQDIDTEAHEVAHALENRYTGIANLQQTHAQELAGVANLTGQSGLSEGFAEFFRLYLTNPPAADAHAPRFRAAFENFIETEDAQTLQDIQEIQAQYQQWRDASSAGRITAAIKTGVPDGTWEKIRAEYDRGGLTRVGGMFWAYLEQVYKSRIDRTNPIRVLVERIARQVEAVNQDIDLSAWRNPQAQARKIPAADGVAYMDITRGVGWENSAGRGSISLRDALSTAFGGTGYEHWTPQQRDDFGAYLIARRGRWLWQRHDMDPARNRGRMASPPQNPQSGDWYFDTMTRQRRVFLRGRWETELTRAPDKHTRADHEQAVADLEAANPQFAVAAQMVYQFNRDLALKRFQAGLDSQEEFDYKNGATDYVPWFRDMTDAIFAGTGVSGRKVQGKFKIRGSYRDFINPVEGIIRQVYDTNREIAVNKPKLLMAQLADMVQGAGRYAEIIPATRMTTQEVKVREVLAQAAKAEGLPPEDAKDMISAVAAMIGDDAVATLFRSEQAGDGRDAILHYMDGGELKMLQIHDDERGIARDILGFFELVRGTPAADSFFGTVSAVVRVPQKAITSSLGFIYRNVIRDSMQASALQAGYFPIVSNIRTIASNRARAARGEETWGELLARHGGIMGGIGRTDVQQIRQGRIAELRSDTVTLKPWERQFWRQTINPWHEDFWKWAEWSEANARQTLARISFDRAIADVRTSYPAMPPDQQTFVALETATNRSRDYTDYSRAGDAPSQAFLNRMIMFLNPSLQGPDKMIRALFLAQTNEGRFATAQLIRKKIAPLFNDNLQYQRLTKSEIDALKDAARAWVTIAIIAHTHLLLEVFFNDPDDLEDKSKLERATSVSFTINGVDYRIPRGFDVINVASNAVKAGYESWWREDPTSWSRFRETLWTSLVPAHSNPILDLYIGWKHGKNNFFNSDIEPTYMKGRLPEDRYSAYTSNLSRQVAEGINSVAPFEVSPLMAEYSMTAIGADWARDIMRAYDIADPNKPALRWQEYPFLRAARGLRGTRGAEEFWTLMGKDGSFVQAAASYRDEAVKGKAWSRDDIRKFFDVRVKDEDAKAYAVMLGHYDAEQKRLHPMERAREFARGISGTMRDVASNRIDVPITSKKEKRVEVSREVRAQALEILAEIGRREYRNALIALKRPGYENREPQPVKPYLTELKTISPEIHKSLIARITNADGSSRVYDYDKVREAWPDIRRRILATDKRERIIEAQGDVEFHDLLGRAQGPKAMGIR